MRALVNRGPRSFVVEEVPDPRPGPGELLVRPLVAGVCITDKHVYDGFGFGPAWREGLVLGHEFDAVVEELGDGVEGWSRGDRVSVDPRVYCRECVHCRAGLATLCERGTEWIGVGTGLDGGMADLCVAPAYGCFPLADAVGDEAGALVEPLAVATRNLRLSGFTAGDTVVLAGLDDYGLLLLQHLREAGAGTIVAVDPSAVRRDAATELGATLVVDPDAGPAHRAIREPLPRGADMVFASMEDYVPAAEHYLRLAFRVCRTQGTVVVLRTYGSAPYAQIDPLTPYMKEITVRHLGFFGEEPARGGRARGDWQLAIEALAGGRVGPLPGTHVMDFEDLGSKASVRDLFASIPGACTKALIRISA